MEKKLKSSQENLQAHLTKTFHQLINPNLDGVILSLIFGLPNLPQFPGIVLNSQEGISNFQISGQSLTKGSCHNSRTSDDNDMKLGPVNKLDKRYKTTSKSFDGEVMSENCDVIAIFSIYDQFGAIWKPDSGHTVCKTYIFVNSKLLSYKD